MIIHLFLLIIIKEKRWLINRIPFMRKYNFFCWFCRVRVETHFPLESPMADSKPWFNSSADVMESLMIENSDVSSAKN